MNDVTQLRDTIVPRSDQLNAESLLSGPMTITVSGVSRGNAEQPVIIHYDNDNGMPYKPCKSMRKVLIFAWGDNGHEWVGKSMTLYNDLSVKWGGVQVGGIRISHMSHIQDDIAISLTATRGKKSQHVIKKLEVVDNLGKYRALLSDAAKISEAELLSVAATIDSKIKKQIGKAFYDSCLATARAVDKPTVVEDDE